MRRESSPRFLFGLLLLALPACGEDGPYRFPVHPADGQVIAAGKPVRKAVVRLHPLAPDALKPPEGEEALPVALITETDDDGRFVFSTYLADDGVPPGDYAVTVTLPVTAGDVENSDGRPVRTKPAGPGSDASYRDPKATPLKATVKEGENHFVFEVK